MDIREKICMERSQLVENGPITIVAFGDSVTHGAVGAGEIDYESVYWNRLKKKINAVRNYVPVNVINAGIGGITAAGSLKRLDAHVLSHSPDLVIVCFGLNDVNSELNEYVEALEEIFMRCLKAGTDVIFMTPNMLNTYVSEYTEPQYKEYAAVTADYQNSGRMDAYMKAACETARRAGVRVCDCYSLWKKMSETRDTTTLLANYINHPVREMHELFADELFNMIFDSKTDIGAADSSTMYT